MEMSEYLVTLSGRILPSENIVLGSQVRCNPSNLCDWTKELRCELFFIIPLMQ
jgi:hypothetical protein